MPGKIVHEIAKVKKKNKERKNPIAMLFAT